MLHDTEKTASTIEFRELVRQAVDGVRFKLAALADKPQPALPLLTYPLMEHRESIEATNAIVLPAPEVGCLIGAFQVYSVGHTFYNGRLVTQPADLSGVAAEWHKITAESIPHRNRIDVAEPAITVITPGHKIYGHWLVDILPRLHVARAALGADFYKRVILLPSDTPKWAISLIHHLFDINLAFRYYDIDMDILYCQDVCVPSFPQSLRMNFHPIVRGLYDPFRASKPGERKLCVSRRNIEGKSSGVVKSFAQRDVFEEFALIHKFEIVYPEEMALPDQIAMMHSARVIVGEYGSALHGSVFAAPGTIVGATGPFNQTQMRICAMSQQSSIYLAPPSWETNNGVLEYGCEIPHIANMFNAIDLELDRLVAIESRMAQPAAATGSIVTE